MAAAETLDIMEEIRALVSDRLQVVSYKWLSRNFSIASDDAKRILQDFVQKHGSELKVVYALSGWLKDDPYTYHIKLVPEIKLSEAKEKFKDNFSIQVYSVQACIPNDLAVLWNSEFIQAEQLFDQPIMVANCLRDNRFCSIANSFVKRDIEGKCGISAPKSEIGASVVSKSSSSFQKLSILPHQDKKMLPQIPNSAAKSSFVNHNEGKSSVGASNKPNLAKERNTVMPTKKLKAESDRLQVNEGSLSSLWGCTNNKQRQSSPIKESIDNAPMLTSAIHANIPSVNEALRPAPNDEKMEQDCSIGSKRKVLLEYSDDEDGNKDDKGNIGNAPLHSEHVISAEQNSVNNETEHKRKEVSTLASPAAFESGDTINIEVNMISEKSQTCASEKVSDKDKIIGNLNPPSSQRKKVLKTRIDERGREVTEVVWEEKDTDGDTALSTTVSNIPASRLPATNKAAASATSSPSIPVPVVKAGNKKNAKGGKDAKQGNIMSFFKKV